MAHVLFSKRWRCFNGKLGIVEPELAHKYDRTHLSPEQQVAEISERRNNLERTLRQIIRNQLKATLGRKSASQKVLSALPESRRNALVGSDIDQLLGTGDSPLYFLDLVNITAENGNCLKISLN